MARAVIELASLNGTNGFRLDGLAAKEFCGGSVAGARDINGDGIDDLVIGAPGDLFDYTLTESKSYVVFGSAAGFRARLDLAALDGTDGFRLDEVDRRDYSGISVDGAGDVNGDGIDDLIIAALTEESYVVFGSAAGFGARVDLAALDGTNGFRLDGTYGNSSVAGVGDLNGDGLGDVIVGSPFVYDGGESFVVFGSFAGFASSLDLAALDGSNGLRLDGTNVGDNSGYSVAGAGDVNGDGIDDLIIGARLANPGDRSEAGQSYIVFGSDSRFPASLELSALDGRNGFTLDGGARYGQSGFSVSAVGDLNGDGIDDLIVGAPYADPNGKPTAGRSYVVFGSASTFAASLNLSALDGTNGFAVDGVSPDDHSGRSVSAAGDVNGDGLDDVIIGAPFTDPRNRGESYVLFGSRSDFPAAFKLSALDGSNGFAISGVGRDDVVGWSVSDAGDVNGDGVDDVIVGAPHFSYYGNDPGQSYVVCGVRTLRGETLAGGAQADTLIGTNRAETIVGRAGGDTLKGLAAGDLLRGAAAGDELNGNGGGDTLKGGRGDDVLRGGVSYDVLLGQPGDDVMLGGLHADRFVFGAAFGADVIGDFDAAPFSGQDVIDLRDLGISEATFEDAVTITDVGGSTRVTVEGFGTLLLRGVSGEGADAIGVADFLLLS